MSRATQLKTLAVAAILAAGMVGPIDKLSAGLMFFGIANVFVAVPGTAPVRLASIAATIGALLATNDARIILALLAWLAWPPAFLIAWAVARERALPEPTDSSPGRAQRSLAAAIGAVGIASIVYRLIAWQGYEQTAILFIGIPTLLAVVVIFNVSPRSATGVACKAVTIGLLVSLIFLGEGVVCVLMSAPLFYIVAVVVGVIIDRLRPRDLSGPSNLTLRCLGVLAIVPFSFEGVSHWTTVDRDSTAVETRIVEATPGEVERALMSPPRFNRVMPVYLRAGFPRPVATRIDRDGGASRWIVRMRGGEMRIDGMEPRTGDLVLQLEAARPGFVRWRALSDGSHMTHFLRWRESTVAWEPVGDHATRVTWTVRYSRDLDPSWYFGWWEHYAASLAAGYLIESVATP